MPALLTIKDDGVHFLAAGVMGIFQEAKFDVLLLLPVSCQALHSETWAPALTNKKNCGVCTAWQADPSLKVGQGNGLQFSNKS